MGKLPQREKAVEPTDTSELSELPQPQPDEREAQEATVASDSDDDYVEDELLVEEISIDGMCGVY